MYDSSWNNFVSIWTYSLLQGGIVPLQIAARNGRLEVVQLLIENYKVSPDALTEVCNDIIIVWPLYLQTSSNSWSQNSDSALHYAVEFGHGNIVSALVQKYHADPTIRNKVWF